MLLSPELQVRCSLTFTSWYTPIPHSISLASSLIHSIQSVPIVARVICYILKGGAVISDHTAITWGSRLTAGDSCKKHMVHVVTTSLSNMYTIIMCCTCGAKLLRSAIVAFVIDSSAMKI